MFFTDSVIIEDEEVTLALTEVRAKIAHLEPNTQTAYQSYIHRLGLDGSEDELEVANRIKRIPNVNSRRTIAIAMRSMFPELKPYVRIEASLPKVYDLDNVPMALAALQADSEHKSKCIPGLLMGFGGLRIGEAIAITSNDLVGNVLNVSKSRNSQGVIKATKGHHGHVVLPGWLAEKLHDYPGTQRLPNSYYKWLRRNYSVTPHSLRHYYATELINSGVNPEVVRRQLRHANLTTTLQVYAQVKANDIESTIESVFG